MDLGQVFTKKIVADYMVSLFSLREDAVFLDPCFGGGAFLSALDRIGKTKVTGYEIDSHLFNSAIDRYPQYLLKKTDFLQAPSHKKYDGIIMNPPYIRHEKINDLASLGVKKEILAKDELYRDLPSTANLYMYFIIKAISLLKKDGEMVVIFPGSWLQAKNGNRFEEALYKNCSVERQIHISGDVFEESALVDVLILKLKKDAKKQQASPEYVKLSNGQLKAYEDETSELKIRFQMPFSSISRVRRGITTGCNRMFINPSLDSNTMPIISSPKQIRGYSTLGADTDNLLVLDSGTQHNEMVKSYLDEWEHRIVETGRPETLAKKIKENKLWYSLNLFDCQGIIFSYFVRDDMKFVYNDSANVVRDNFYILYPTINKWVCFALLNNLYTYYQLECAGKKYGAGLLKIQRYDIEELTFPDTSAFSSADLSRMSMLAEKLAKTGKHELVYDITTIISKYTNISYESIFYEYKKIVKSRLENV